MTKSTREEVLVVLVASATRYFRSRGREVPEVGAAIPLVPGRASEVLLDFAARIEISGAHRGWAVLSLERALAESVARDLGAKAVDATICGDVTGEMANTIVGNARRELGANFVISVPVLISGQLAELPLGWGAEIRVVAFTWRDRRAFLLVCLGVEK